jgi:hypothetical protein
MLSFWSSKINGKCCLQISTNLVNSKNRTSIFSFDNINVEHATTFQVAWDNGGNGHNYKILVKFKMKLEGTKLKKTKLSNRWGMIVAKDK